MHKPENQKINLGFVHVPANITDRHVAYYDLFKMTRNELFRCLSTMSLAELIAAHEDFNAITVAIRAEINCIQTASGEGKIDAETNGTEGS